jgi:hypothetical protein
VEAVGCRIIVGARWQVGRLLEHAGRLDDDLALVLPQPGLLLRRTTAPPAAWGLVDPSGVDWLPDRVVHSGSVMNR